MSYEIRLDLAGAIRPIVADGPHRIELTSPISNRQYTIVLEPFGAPSVLVGAPSPTELTPSPEPTKPASWTIAG